MCSTSSRRAAVATARRRSGRARRAPRTSTAASSVEAGEDGGRMFKHVVTTESELRDLLGSPSDRAIKKDVAVLDEHCRAFIARSPFLLLATASAKGRCDVSPKGDAPGFVRVLDDRHLVIPDRPGDRKSTRLNSSHGYISYAVF